jgi:hypothetical protein
VWCEVRLLDLILPVRCVVCDAAGEQLCRACRDALPRLGPPLCDRCGAPTAWPVARCRECSGRRLAFASARAAVAYDESIRRLVRSWKERGLRTLAAVAADSVAAALPPPPAALALSRPIVRAVSSEANTQRSDWPASSANAGLCRCFRSSGGPGRSRDSVGCHSPNAGATSPVRSPLRASPRRASSSSTTSTRPAPPRAPPRRPCARRAPEGSTWLRSRESSVRFQARSQASKESRCSSR